MEHETQTRMFNGIQISNLKTPIKISLHWVKALGYNTENHPVWLPSKCITNQAHNLSFHKNSTRIDFNYHLILISLSCQKKKVPYTWNWKLAAWTHLWNFKDSWFTSDFPSVLIVTGRMPQSPNYMMRRAGMPMGLVKTDGEKKPFWKLCQNECYKLG